MTIRFKLFEKSCRIRLVYHHCCFGNQYYNQKQLPCEANGNFQKSVGVCQKCLHIMCLVIFPNDFTLAAKIVTAALDIDIIIILQALFRATKTKRVEIKFNRVTSEKYKFVIIYNKLTVVVTGVFRVKKYTTNQRYRRLTRSLVEYNYKCIIRSRKLYSYIINVPDDFFFF